MTKKICDRCGAEINPGEYATTDGSERMTLKEALDTIAEYCRRHNCGDCEFNQSRNYYSCKLQTESPEDYDKIPIVETNMYDKREVHENCTVEILTNTKTGETSIGWYENK